MLLDCTRPCADPREWDDPPEVEACPHPRQKMGYFCLNRHDRYVNSLFLDGSARKIGLKLLPTTPQDYISRFCNELALSGDVQAKTIEILQAAAEKELTSGRGPTGLAAASLYIASILCGERRTQREVAEVAGVTEVTIRNRYKELAERLDITVIT